MYKTRPSRRGGGSGADVATNKCTNDGRPRGMSPFRGYNSEPTGGELPVAAPFPNGRALTTTHVARNNLYPPETAGSG